MLSVRSNPVFVPFLLLHRIEAKAAYKAAEGGADSGLQQLPG